MRTQIMSSNSSSNNSNNSRDSKDDRGVIGSGCCSSIEGSFLVTDISHVYNQVHLWYQELPMVQPFYAVKCNPDPIIIDLLSRHPCRSHYTNNSGDICCSSVNFDCATESTHINGGIGPSTKKLNDFRTLGINATVGTVNWKAVKCPPKNWRWQTRVNILICPWFSD